MRFIIYIFQLLTHSFSWHFAYCQNPEEICYIATVCNLKFKIPDIKKSIQSFQGHFVILDPNKRWAFVVDGLLKKKRGCVWEERKRDPSMVTVVQFLLLLRKLVCMYIRRFSWTLTKKRVCLKFPSESPSNIGHYVLPCCESKCRIKWCMNVPTTTITNVIMKFYHPMFDHVIHKKNY